MSMWPEGYLEKEVKFCEKELETFYKAEFKEGTYENERLRTACLCKRQEFARRWLAGEFR